MQEVVLDSDEEDDTQQYPNAKDDHGRYTQEPRRTRNEGKNDEERCQNGADHGPFCYIQQLTFRYAGKALSVNINGIDRCDRMDLRIGSREDRCCDTYEDKGGEQGMRIFY